MILLEMIHDDDDGGGGIQHPPPPHTIHYNSLLSVLAQQGKVQ